MDMSQRDKMRLIFKENPNELIRLPEVMAIAAQYNARIKELRAEGMLIKNMKKKVDGKWHSWFIYIPEKSKNQEPVDATTTESMKHPY
ncbi:hypothetical protein LCGC14_2218240 [marine sediment metagenome]|uniref:Uncharacterized protein n=1 Tax=marine sediment metagenome TaxID=412755 RepID=A0A0F9FPC0_9ZZZZ